MRLSGDSRGAMPCLVEGDKFSLKKTLSGVFACSPDCFRIPPGAMEDRQN